MYFITWKQEVLDEKYAWDKTRSNHIFIEIVTAPLGSVIARPKEVLLG